MNETTNLNAAGPALAAHSKDGSAPGPTPASSATGDHGDPKGPAQQAYGQAVDHVRDCDTDNPIGSLLAAASLGFVLGLMVARG